ncbi:ATPase, V1 complex, subunit H [Gigaspora margarita]|uniref:V-type proton ATPase subunit H n=1 Tax=Gigaspora margarita TaxID=4874 RepID=A0A8H4AFH8_GIGMA|nr:ATPase, V1 complex, subunit H [Gigaspora margarita]
MTSTNSNDESVPDVPLAFVSNTYLNELTKDIRTRPIPWEGYQKAELITPEELDLLKRIDKQSREQLRSVMQKDAEKYAELYTSLLEKLKRFDTIQYILVMTNDMLSDDEKRASYFHKLSSKSSDLPYRPFLKMLDSSDEFIPLGSAKILTILICSALEPLSFDTTDFLRWISTKLKSNNNNICDLAVQILESILKIPSCRLQFWEMPHGIDTLVNYLKAKNPTLQMQYQIIFCFWLLTFERDVAVEFNRKYDLIPTLINIAKSAIKEKIIRIIIRTFRNLVEKAPEANLPAMLVAKLLNFCENLSVRKWSDSEIVEDIEFLKAQLQENFHSLTTFDEYASEIRSGMLQWSPPHESEQFWKQNVTKLNDKNHELLKILSRLLSTSTDNVVLAVAAHDLGQYVKYYPDGKKILQEIGAKQRVMELMTHEDPEVRYNALIAVQKYMSHAWNF